MTYELSSRHRASALLALAMLAADTGAALAQAPIRVTMQRGPISDYGASPWYTTDFHVGRVTPRLALDNGADFTWITSDKCGTDACNAHIKINTQPPFFWVDTTTQTRSFGTWGDMLTWTGADVFNLQGVSLFTMPFFASVSYSGNQFQYLPWDGGIGFPSNTASVTKESGFFFGQLLASGRIANPTFSMWFDAPGKVGQVLLGGIDASRLDPSTDVRLRPASAPGLADTWGTRLDSAAIGGRELPELSGILFWLDSGSSRFKGDAPYVYPIFADLLGRLDSLGRPIFRPVYEKGVLTGLQYIAGGPSTYGSLLPTLTLRLGDQCGGFPGRGAVSLTPTQYSYYVETGERAGTWMIAIHRLDGIGGLLVGSSLLDLIYSSYTYGGSVNNLVQGDMHIYRRSTGPTVPIRCLPPR